MVTFFFARLFVWMCDLKPDLSLIIIYLYSVVICLAIDLLFHFDSDRAVTLALSFLVGTHLVALPVGCFGLACWLECILMALKLASLFPSSCLAHAWGNLFCSSDSDGHYLCGSFMAWFQPQQSSLFINRTFNMSINSKILFMYEYILYGYCFDLRISIIIS